MTWDSSEDAEAEDPLDVQQNALDETAENAASAMPAALSAMHQVDANLRPVATKEPPTFEPSNSQEQFDVEDDFGEKSLDNVMKRMGASKRGWSLFSPR